MPTHDGHRDRVRQRFLKEGLESFEDYQILELLLFYSIPRRDTNPIAHELIETFGGLHQVFDAPYRALMDVGSIGASSALLLKLIPAVAKQYEISQQKVGVQLCTTNEYGKYLIPHFVGKRNETVYLLCLDSRCQPICCIQMDEGDVTSARVSPRKVVQTALNMQAASVILAHNHPSGFATPSPEDILTTRRIAMALDGVDIPLVDHIIVSDDDFVSLVQSNYYNPDECRRCL